MLDRLGILGSAICAVHCALPLIFSFISPSISSAFGNELVHYALLVLVVPVAAFSFLQSKKIHKKAVPFILGSIGVLFLIAAIALEGVLGSSIPNFELLATVSGSFILILAHLINLKLMSEFKSAH